MRRAKGHKSELKQSQNCIMKKLSLLLLIISLASAYIFSALHSFHQVHKSIYYDNKQLSKDYVEWEDVRTQIKDYINVSLVDKVSKHKDFAESGEIGFLVAGLAGKFAEHAVDQYINPEGLSFLIKNSSKRSKIPEPTFETLIAGISLLNFDSFNSFHVNIESEGKKISIHFRRIGVKWKVDQIEFSDHLMSKLIENLG